MSWRSQQMMLDERAHRSRRDMPTGAAQRGARSPDVYTDLIGKSLYVMLGRRERRQGGQADNLQALQRAVDAARAEDTAWWPAPARALLAAAEAELEGRVAIEHPLFVAACEARWPVRPGWAARADIGDAG